MSSSWIQPVAIVTGAGRGIGRAISLELGQRGYRVAAVGRRREPLEEVASRTEGMAIVADVSAPAEAERAVRETLEKFGRVDVLVNNAGFAPAVSVAEMSVEQWRQVIDVNLSAAFYLSRAAWGAFERQKGGVIVNISSQSSRDPFAGFAAYGAAKAGLNLLTLVLAREGAPINVRAHAVAPGAVETEMFRGLATEEQWPREKTLEPEEVARVVAACVCGDLRYSSGEVIYLSKTRG